jgi:hypothetical protein
MNDKMKNLTNLLVEGLTILAGLLMLVLFSIVFVLLMSLMFHGILWAWPMGRL